MYFFKSRINVKNNKRNQILTVTNDLINNKISKRIFKSFNENKIMNQLEKYFINYFCK